MKENWNDCIRQWWIWRRKPRLHFIDGSVFQSFLWDWFGIEEPLWSERVSCFINNLFFEFFKSIQIFSIITCKEFLSLLQTFFSKILKIFFFGLFQDFNAESVQVKIIFCWSFWKNRWRSFFLFQFFTSDDVWWEEEEKNGSWFVFRVVENNLLLFCVLKSGKIEKKSEFWRKIMKNQKIY